jgi:LPS sulfotransferase NodH
MVRFLLLAHARSGSNLLMCGLFKQRNVHMFAELFNELEEERRRSFRASFQDCKTASVPHASVKLDENEFYHDGEDGARFLERAVFYRHARESVAVGFKMFFHQARSTENARKVWQYLICDPEIRIIHLMRRNLLESFVSLQLAFQTDQWIFPRNGEAPPVPPPLYVCPKECADYFRNVLAGRRWAREQFRDHPSIEVEYEEDLCRRFQATMNRVQEFLGVPRRRSRRMLRKQAQRRPSEQISNYAELKAHFAPTPYARWFE